MFLINIDNMVNFIHLISIKVIEDDALAFVTNPPPKEKKNSENHSQNVSITFSSADQTNQILFLKVCNECINIFIPIPG